MFWALFVQLQHTERPLFICQENKLLLAGLSPMQRDYTPSVLTERGDVKNTMDVYRRENPKGHKFVCLF